MYIPKPYSSLISGVNLTEEVLSFVEKRYVLTKFCSSFHCFIAFNEMEFDP